MNHKPFVIKRIINAPLERVWQAITIKDQMKQWYFDVSDFKPEVGFQFTFEGGDGNETFVHLCTITEVVSQSRLTHTWQYQGQEEKTYVTWELFAEGDSTRIRLTHEGLERIGHHGRMFARTNFEAGWTDIVGNLLPAFVEKQ